MGSLLSKEVFYLSLCLITLLSLASCASTVDRSLAEESVVKRAPDNDSRVNNNNKITNGFYSRGTN